MSIIDSYHKHPVIIGNIRVPMFFRFTQNPNNWNLKMDKEYNQTRTINGYVYEHWGKKPMDLSFDVHIKKDGNLNRLLGLNTKDTNYELVDPTFTWELMTLQTLFNIDQRKYQDMTLLKDGVNLVKDGVNWVKDNVIGTATKQIVADNKLTTPSTLKTNEIRGASASPHTIESYLDTMTDTIIYYRGCIYSGFFKDLSYSEDAKEPFWYKVHLSFLVTNTTLDWIDNMLVDTAAGRVLLQVWGGASSVTTVGSLLSDVLGNIL